MDTQRQQSAHVQAGRQILANVPLSMVLSDPNQPDNPIVYVNRAFERITGYAGEAVIGRNCRFLQGEDREQHGARDIGLALTERRSTVITLINYRADGSRFLNRLMISPVNDERGELMAFVGFQAEVFEEGPHGNDSVMRFDDRLQEMQHRVKNHLQMVASMIRLQSRDKSTPQTGGFDVIARRVDALALLYDEFSAPPGKAGGQVRYDVVSAGAYVSRVANTVGALDGSRNIRIGIDTDAVYMRTQSAAQLGLLTSEVLSNTLQHAFEGRTEGMVQVRLKQLGGDRVRLSIEDDGVGLGASGWPQKGNLGARIVIGLVQQLDANLKVTTNDNGTHVMVDFHNALDTTLDAEGARMLAEPSGDRAGARIVDGTLADGVGTATADGGVAAR